MDNIKIYKKSSEKMVFILEIKNIATSNEKNKKQAEENRLVSKLDINEIKYRLLINIF